MLYRAVSQQMADAGVKVGLNRISNAEKQELAETLLYDAAFMGGLVQRAQNEPAVRRQIRQMAISGTREVFGFDIAKLRLTPTGLAR